MTMLILIKIHLVFIDAYVGLEFMPYIIWLTVF